MTRPRALPAVVAALAAVALCSAAGGTTGTAAHTRAQLSYTVLPKPKLGAEARPLVVAIGSGYTDSAAAAEETTDPTDTAEDLGSAGRYVGYQLSYADVSGRHLLRGKGLVEIGSSVEIFGNARDANAFLTKQVQDTRRFRGERIGFGRRLVAARSFKVGKLGHRSLGLRTTVDIGRHRVYETRAAFRVGSLLAEIVIDRADARSATATARRLLTVLARRVQLVAAGRLRTAPVPVPRPSRNRKPPKGGPNLAPMVLAPSDLPRGATVRRSSYVRDRATLGTYTREFDASAARFGGSTITFVESAVSLLRNVREASGFLVGLRAQYSARGVEEDLTQALSAGGAANVRGLIMESRDRPPGISDGFAIVIRYSIDGQSYRTAFVHLRVDRVVGSLAATGRASSFDYADVEPFAAKLAARIQEHL